MPAWLHKFTSFISLSKEERQGIIVSKILDQVVTKRIGVIHADYGIQIEKDDVETLAEAIYLYSSQLVGTHHRLKIYSDPAPLNISDIANTHPLFIKYYPYVYGFHYSPSDRASFSKSVREKNLRAKYVVGVIPYAVDAIRSELDDLGRFLAEEELSGMILQEVVAAAGEKLGDRNIVEADIENRIRRWY